MTDRTAPSGVTTEVFTSTSGQYFCGVLSLWLPRYWWTIVTPIALTGALGVALDDWRFVLIALMLIFIAAPMLISFLYTYYMLTPEARMAIRPKSVEIQPGRGLTLLYEPYKTAGDGEEEENELPREAERIDVEMIREVKFSSTNIVYILNTPRLQFILVPYAALPQGVTREELRMA